MINSRFVLLSLTVAGCAAAAYGIGRSNRRLEKRELKEDLRIWEGEGGTLGPAETAPKAPAITAS